VDTYVINCYTFNNIILVYFYYLFKGIINYRIYIYKMSVLETLTVYKAPYEKIRVGKQNDGGYVICMLPGDYDYLVSGGIAGDISFEQHFLDLKLASKCVAFDGTIEKLPLTEDDNRIQFIKKNIAPINNESLTNLHEYIEPYENVFLKLDIEGHEFLV